VSIADAVGAVGRAVEAIATAAERDPAVFRSRAIRRAAARMAVTLVLADDVDASRGSMIIGLDNPAGTGTDLHAKVCWMHPKPLVPGRKYYLKHTSSTVQAAVTEIVHRLNIETLDPEPAPAALALNDLGEIRLRTARPLYYDGYATNRLTGSFILIEQGTNATVAAGMLLPPTEVVRPENTDYAI